MTHHPATSHVHRSPGKSVAIINSGIGDHVSRCREHDAMRRSKGGLQENINTTPVPSAGPLSFTLHLGPQLPKWTLPHENSTRSHTKHCSHASARPSHKRRAKGNHVKCAATRLNASSAWWSILRSFIRHSSKTQVRKRAKHPGQHDESPVRGSRVPVTNGS